MHLRLLKTGDCSKKVLYSAGIAGHGMCLKLTYINNIISFDDWSYKVEGMVHKTFAACNHLRCKIHIKLYIRVKALKTAYTVYIFDIFRVIQSA